jgi:hypothetical protein
MARWWWLEPKHAKSRCTAANKDPYMPGRCKHKSFRDGLCKVHLRLIGKMKKCRTCKQEH